MEKKILRQQEHKGGLVIAVGLFHVGLFTDDYSMITTIASSLEAEQDSEAQIRFKAASKQSNDPPLLRVNTLGSGEDNMKLKELMELCTKLSERILDKKTNKIQLLLLIPILYPLSLNTSHNSKEKNQEETKKDSALNRAYTKETTPRTCHYPSYDYLQVVEIECNLLNWIISVPTTKVVDLEQVQTLKQRRLLLGCSEDASNRKKSDVLDADAKVTLVDETQEMNDDNLMFDTSMLKEHGIEFEKVVKEPVVSVATITKSIPVSAAKVVTTASASVEIPDELTLAQTLIEIKTAKPKPVTTAATTVTSIRPRAKGIIFHDQE
ncbi:hypothetical protein Tco_1125115 [Tanacetum coccineum]|uniref:Uncharacterized protein n=1 Tax=Tanacetum coccineum TaxID=301880 RepID=A0ABQ5J825_9ASTR